MMKRDSFIIPLSVNAFQLLAKLSAFYAVRKLSKGITGKDIFAGNYSLVDIWVLGHLLLAGVSVFLPNNNVLFTILAVYGVSRVFESFVYKTNIVAGFDEWHAKKIGKPYLLHSSIRTIWLNMLNITELVCWSIVFYDSFGFSLKAVWALVGMSLLVCMLTLAKLLRLSPPVPELK